MTHESFCRLHEAKKHLAMLEVLLEVSIADKPFLAVMADRVRNSIDMALKAERDEANRQDDAAWEAVPVCPMCGIESLFGEICVPCRQERSGA